MTLLLNWLFSFLYTLRCLGVPAFAGMTLPSREWRCFVASVCISAFSKYVKTYIRCVVEITACLVEDSQSSWGRFALFLSGDNSDTVPPDSISNSEVKRISGDGSVGFPHVRVAHRQTPFLLVRETTNPILTCRVFLCLKLIALIVSIAWVCIVHFLKAVAISARAQYYKCHILYIRCKLYDVIHRYNMAKNTGHVTYDILNK